MNIEIGNKKIDFVYQGDNLIYPNYSARENIILHYDFSGMKNSDVTKAIAEDLSDNGNNGVLQNFAYTNESGYLDNTLIFDDIDDFITIPKPLIDLNNFTYSEGTEVLSFRGDEVARVVDGGIEIGGRNLMLDSSILTMLPKNTGGAGDNYTHTTKVFSKELEAGQNYSVSAKVEVTHGEADRITFVFRTPENANAHIIYVPIVNGEIKFNLLPPENLKRVLIYSGASGATRWVGTTFREIKVERGNKPTDWTPAPEDLETTTFKPLFDKKIKSALYWNRALTDEELLQVYNTQIKRT